MKKKDLKTSVSGKIIDIHERKIFSGSVTVSDGKILSIEEAESACDFYILPGLVDSHIHIESSMITPGAFAKAAVKQGTVAVVSDPHEIANVMGMQGVSYMLRDAGEVPLKFYFGAPSCVPATMFETSGASLNSDEVKKLLSMPEIHYLSEMMNYPGVIYDDKEVGEKLNSASAFGKPVDGHAPGLSGQMLEKYVSKGISTDHECSNLSEALEKIGLGMKIIIREGSAARNLDALKSLYGTNPGMLMLCSDDLHPDLLKVRHINKLIAKLVNEGYDIFDIIRSATIIPKQHYKLETGTLMPGNPADFIVVDDIRTMNVIETWIDGRKVYENGSALFNYIPGKPVNNFNCSEISTDDILVRATAEKVKVIKAFDGELLTGEISWEHKQGDRINARPEEDMLKLVVKDRYNDSPPSIAFINGFGLKNGAIASSIGHDSHNIICVGASDDDIVNAVNEIVTLKGGLAVSAQGITNSIQLNIAGIMSTMSCDEIAAQYDKLNCIIKSLGCSMNAPFMTLSFMALLVIPELKLSDKGLFDVKQFSLTSIFT
ncbi:MAG TPA: adenine deaminase [Bacteroidales bacterium]|nr:adenine deaminase [Bacteroidales bacterium]